MSSYILNMIVVEKNILKLDIRLIFVVD